jgi:hypothetical protein
MRVLVFGKATKESEAGELPTDQQFKEMEKYVGELIKAGVLLEGGGLHPSSKGRRVRFQGKQRTVIDGPFMETKELIAGWQFWQVKSMDEAVEWARRAPFWNGEEVEIRPVLEPEDHQQREEEARVRAEGQGQGRS